MIEVEGEGMDEVEEVGEIQEIEAGVEEIGQPVSCATSMGMMPVIVRTDLIQISFNHHLRLMKNQFVQEFSYTYQRPQGMNPPAVQPTNTAKLQPQPQAYFSAQLNPYVLTTQEVHIPADSQAWYPDLGATHHVTSDPQHFNQGTNYM